MLLSCPNCGAVTKIADILIPSARLTATCAGCGGKIGGTVPARLDGGRSKARESKKGNFRRSGPTQERSRPPAAVSAAAGRDAGERSSARDAGEKRTEAGSARRRTERAGGVNRTKPSVADSARSSLTTVARGLDPERLANLIASDLLLYNREKVQKNVAEGNLLSSMATEIIEAWDFYKKRVGVHTALGTPYFRDALNSIVSGRDPVI